MLPNRLDMERVAANLQSKSAKIRALAEAGSKRSDIARFMDVRYQFVRNVLVADERRSATIPSAADKPSRSADDRSLIGNSVRITMDSGGKVVLPVHMREALGLQEGDKLIASLEDGEVRLSTVPAAIRRVQALVRQFVPEGVSLVDELLEDRRREVEREQQS